MGACSSALAVRRGERLFVELAAGPGAVREAQALRYRVFSEELGARLKPGFGGLDVDEIDDYCHHLIVRETGARRLVGCTRLLNGADARRLGRWYSENELDLGAIPRLPGNLLEVGRTCISPECRQGSAIAVLWSGIAGYIRLHGIDFLFGCASVPLGEGDCRAAAIMNRLRRRAMADPHLRVTPRAALRECNMAADVPDAPLPALLKAYLHLGATVCGEPCRDPDFEVGDVLILLDVNQLRPAYARHFMERAG